LEVNPRRLPVPASDVADLDRHDTKRRLKLASSRSRSGARDRPECYLATEHIDRFATGTVGEQRRSGEYEKIHGGKMSNPLSASERFEADYSNALAMLLERRPDDSAVDDLLDAEEALASMGTADSSPSWIRPFAAVVANVAQENIVRLASTSGGLATVIPDAIGPALMKAVQLGYTDGYLAGRRG
jgi:hypothetical protein|tara:strand:+ start:6009 stop:6566 length:558 start_codon:yes stop_codon:yes gene_type:complete